MALDMSKFIFVVSIWIVWSNYWDCLGWIADSEAKWSGFWFCSTFATCRGSFCWFILWKRYITYTLTFPNYKWKLGKLWVLRKCVLVKGTCVLRHACIKETKHLHFKGYISFVLDFVFNRWKDIKVEQSVVIFIS